MKKLACLLLLAVSLSGCGTRWSFDDDLYSVGGHGYSIPVRRAMVMSGTRYDLMFLRFNPLLALDLPFSLAADAALLPFTLVQSATTLLPSTDGRPTRTEAQEAMEARQEVAPPPPAPPLTRPARKEVR